MKFSIKDISKSLRISLGTRYVKYGGFAAIVTVAVIAAVIFINLIIQQFSPQLDLTETKRFSMSEQTMQVLGEINSPVTFYGIWKPGEGNPEVKEVVDLYTARSRFIRFEEIDPDLNPGLVRQFNKDNQGVDQGSLVVRGEKGFKVIPALEMYDYYYDQQGRRQFTGVAVERRITGALLYASTGTTPVVYEIIGHEELLLSRFGMKETVEQENYTLLELNLLQSPVPGDASALILNNPKTALAPRERERLLEYLSQGGRLLVMMNFEAKNAVESVNEVLSSYGIQLDYGLVMEMDRSSVIENPFVFRPAAPVGPPLADGSGPGTIHDIVKPLVENNSFMVMFYSSGFSALDARRRTVSAVPFLTSSASAFLRTDLEAMEEKSAGDLPGPISLGMAVMDPQYSQDGKQTRIVTLGAPVFDTVRFFGMELPGNIDLFMNSLTWIENRPENLSVRSRSLFVMPMSISALEQLIFGIFFVVIIPLVLFVLALVTWLRRRHL